MKMQSSSRAFRVQCVVIIAGTWFVSHGFVFAQDPERIAIVQRLERLQNWIAAIDSELVTDFDPSLEDDAARLKAFGLNRLEREHLVFEFAKGRAKVETTLDPENVAAARRQGIPDVQLRIVTSTPERSEELFRRDPDSPAGGVIREPSSVPNDWTFDVGLGVRLLGEQTWLEVSMLRDAQLVISPDGNATLTISRPNGLLHELSFERQFHYALVKYRVTPRGRPETYEQIECSEFRRVGGIFVPFKMIRFNQYRDTAATLRRPFTRTLVIRSFELVEGKEDEARLLIEWPAGARVRHMSSDVVISVGPTSRPLPDAAISEELKKLQVYREALEERSRERIDRSSGAPVPPGTPGR